jgi:hypothetical protein
MQVQVLAFSAMTVEPTTARLRSTKEPGSISRRDPRLRMRRPRISRSGSRDGISI